MKLSARNILKGTVTEVVTASITNEAVEELGLKKGSAASAVIKASDVIVAVG
jgi:molybdopterin-binding protein